jgi:hypothetical protein
MEPYRGVEPRCFAWKANVFPLDQYGPVGPAGIEPAYAGLRPAANPSQLETRSRDPRSRTAFLLNPNQADYRLPRSRDVLRQPPMQHGGDDGNRTRCDDACRACPLPQLSSPWALRRLVQPVPPHRHVRQAWRPADNGAHAIDVSTNKHVHPRVVLRRDRRS